MIKINKSYITLGSLFITLILLEYFAPKEPDWSKSFSKDDKIPFGSYIMYDLLPDIFPQSDIEIKDKNIYKYIDDINIAQSTFIYNTDNFDLTDKAINRLLELAAQGAKIFISANGFPEKLSDTLQFKTEMNLNFILPGDSLPVNFVHKKLYRSGGYVIGKQNYAQYFSRFDSSKTVILGIIGNKKLPNYLKIPFGKGFFYVHSLPLAFTNYNILQEHNADYVFKALSYLKNKHIYWDEYYKPQKMMAQKSPLYYIQQSPALRNAYHLLLLIALMFLLINGKRKQKPIPLIEPLKNSSLEFAQTLANLYLNTSNHKDILLKRYLYWKEFLREKYYINSKIFSQSEAAEKIAKKTESKVSLIKNIMMMHEFAQNNELVTAEKLEKFNNYLEKFYQSSN